MIASADLVVCLTYEPLVGLPYDRVDNSSDIKLLSPLGELSILLRLHYGAKRSST